MDKPTALGDLSAGNAAQMLNNYKDKWPLAEGTNRSRGLHYRGDHSNVLDRRPRPRDSYGDKLDECLEGW